MMSIDQLTGGNVEPRGLEEEMRSSYLDYAMSVIVGRALPDVRDGLKPVHRRVLFAMHESGLQPNRPFRKASRVVGDVMGTFHPHGDSAIYDTLVRLGAGLRDALPAGRPAGQLRVDRQRPAGGDALHRGASLAAGHRDAARHRRGHGRLRPQLRRVAPGAARPAVALPEPARQRRRPGSPSAWRRTSRRTTCASRSTRRSPTSTIPQIDVGGPDEAHQGPGLPDRRDHRRPRRHPRGVRDRPRPRGRARRAPTSSRCARARRRSSSPRCPTRSPRATGATTARA